MVLAGVSKGGLAGQAANVFVAMSYFGMLRFSIQNLPQGIGMILQAKVSMDRMTLFLRASELGASQPTKMSAPIVVATAAGVQQECALVLTDAAFRWDVVVDENAPDSAGTVPPPAGPSTATATAPTATTASSAAAAAAPVATTASGEPSAGAAVEAQAPVAVADVSVSVPASAPAPAATATAAAAVDGVAAAKDTLHHLNVQIVKGSLTMIVGAVGSGKSTLFAGMLGELNRSAGTVHIFGRVGYCAQQAWIQNATLRDNILFGAPFDATKYGNVIQACALARDLEVLTDGDMTQIGEKGINLSGGQKQRINLARAVYNEPDIVLLDDPLSAVDAHVAHHLFDACIGGALKGKTRVLVTHQLAFCSAPTVDRILVIKDGTIFEDGSFTTLMANPAGELHRLMEEFRKVDLDQDGDDDEQVVDVLVNDLQTDVVADCDAAAALQGEAVLVAASTTERSVNKTMSSKKRREKKAVNEMDAVQAGVGGKDKAVTQLVAEEDRAVGSLSLDTYLYYLRSAGSWWYPVLALVVNVLAQAAGMMVTSYWLAFWTEDAFKQSLSWYMGIYAALGVAQCLLTGVGSALITYVGTMASTNIHNLAFRGLMKAPMSWFDTTPMGRILNRFSTDMSTVDNALPSQFNIAFLMFLIILFSFVQMLISFWYIIVPLVPLGWVYYWVQSYYRASSVEIKRLASTSQSPLVAFFGETLQGMSTIRAYDAMGRFQATNSGQIDNVLRTQYLQQRFAAWLSMRLEVLGAVIVGLGAGLAVFLAKTISPGLVGAALAQAMAVTGFLNFIIHITVDLENSMNSVERLKHYIDQLPQEAAHRVEKTAPTAEWPAHGAIEFQFLQLRYRPELPLVLDNISLTVKGGEKVGVVGRTGAGKSSLMAALFRLTEVDSGGIFIDGIDIATLGLADLRERLAIIPQDPVLYLGTIRDNVDPFRKYSEEAVWAALDRVVMAATLKELQGLETAVSENGENFSVGQRYAPPQTMSVRLCRLRPSSSGTRRVLLVLEGGVGHTCVCACVFFFQCAGLKFAWRGRCCASRAF